MFNSQNGVVPVAEFIVWQIFTPFLSPLSKKLTTKPALFPTGLAHLPSSFLKTLFTKSIQFEKKNCYLIHAWYTTVIKF